MNTKEQLINQIIEVKGYSRYLEIGTQHGTCYNQIKCLNKFGVDPKPLKLYDGILIMTSDEFFKINDGIYDLIFIDGLHEAEQALADLTNAASTLEYGGTILMHDMMPTSEITQEVPRRSKEWYGDVWKVNYLLLKGKYDLITEFHDFDCGILDIRLGQNSIDLLLCEFSDNLERLKNITYKKNFEEYLELIS